VAIFCSHPIQYQAPLWRQLAADPGLDLLVVFGTDMSIRGYKDREFGVSFAWDQPLTEGYRHHFLSTDPSISHIERWRPSPKGIGRVLDQFRPQVGVLTAYNHVFHMGAFAALRARRIPIIMRHEASDVAVERGHAKAALRDFLLRRLYKGVARFAAIGTEARRHLLRLGVPQQRIGYSPYCVDSDFVEAQVRRWSPRRAEIRRELKASEEDPVVVFSGKLIPKKNPLLIADALRVLKMRGQARLLDRLHVIIAGEGALRAELGRELRALIGERAHLLGFLNQGEMGRAYAAADALVLPSRRGGGETWGLVVNEALQYGLPCLVSDGVGCQVDLISGMNTGSVFRSGSEDGLATCLKQWLDVPSETRIAQREKCREFVGRFSSKTATAGLVDCIRNVAESGGSQ
jgi:glycosyltransferase involved in cell wall biosynthesis